MTHKATMYGQGRGWVVSSWSDMYDCYVLSGEMTYAAARAYVGRLNCPGEHGGTCRCASHEHEEQEG